MTTFVDRVCYILNEMFSTPPNENTWSNQEEFVHDFKEKIQKEYDLIHGAKSVQVEAGSPRRGRPRKEVGV